MTTPDSYLLVRRLNDSCPFRHLVRKRAVRTIGFILHTKIFVDLEEPLLVGNGFQESLAPAVISEETGRSCFDFSVRQLSLQACVFCPKTFARASRAVGIVCE